MQKWKRFLSALIAAASFTSLSACSALDRYSRTYSIDYDANTKTGGVSITLTPVTPLAPPIAPPAALSDATIEKIVKLIMDSRQATLPDPLPVDFKQPVEAIQ